MPPPPPRRRARACGLEFGSIPTGPLNAITDVPGVRVGQVTVWNDPDSDGAGAVARTGVTAIVLDDVAAMFRRPMTAGVAVLNGAGELTGSIEIREWGILETPIVLVSTNNVGRAYDAVVDAVLEAGIDDVVIPVVGECDDSSLDDIRARSLSVAHVRHALDTASDGGVAEGVVGAGCGMITMGHKAGIGTASRVTGGGTVGVLLLCNFGGVRLLRVGGMLVGPLLEGHVDGRQAAVGMDGRQAADGADGRQAADAAAAPPRDTGGSCIGVVVTDIPLDPRQLERVARRVGLGLGRVGSVAHHGSGDIFCAVSTTNRVDRDAAGMRTSTVLADAELNDIFTAVVDATEEAVINALFVADTVIGRDGFVAKGLPVVQIVEWLG